MGDNRVLEIDLKNLEASLRFWLNNTPAGKLSTEERAKVAAFLAKKIEEGQV